MGELIRLDDRRKARRARAEAPAYVDARVEFLFDLGDPFTYLAAERVDRGFASIAWIPASAATLRGGAPYREDELARLQAAAEARAAGLRLPLEWPEPWPADVPAAMRVAHHAAERGRGPAFVLAAGRMAFGGGFDLRDPETLAEVAAAAGLDAAECARAAGEERRDAAIQRAARQLLAARVTRVPALRVEGVVFAGESRIAEAAASARARIASA